MIPKEIERGQIVKALAEIDRTGVPIDREPTGYELVYEGKTYPPKYVVSIASKLATGNVLDPSKFSGGQETNEFLSGFDFQIRPKTIQSSTYPLHLLFKWSAKFDAHTIEKHRTLAESQGSVWWGKFDQSGSYKMSSDKFSKLRDQLRAQIPTFVFLYRQGQIWRTNLHEITTEKSDVDQARLPTYYTKEQCGLFVRISGFTLLEPNWAASNLTLASDPDVSIVGALANQTTPLFVYIRETRAQEVDVLSSTLNEAIASVLALQPKWSSSNTPDMQRRGELIRDQIPKLLEPLGKKHGLNVKGSDGSGLKNRVPWVRIYDPRFSPKATDGWYTVLLFAADASALFLSLNQGTNKATGPGEYVPRDPSVLARRVKEAREELGQRGVELGGLLEQIQLADPGLGEGYERGNVYAVKYPASNLPPDVTILADTSRLLALLKLLYNTELRSEGAPAAYLLAWNPKNWPWTGLPELAAQFRSGRQIEGNESDSTWSVANKSVKPGDRLFLVRLGKEPKGIMGSGYALSVPFEDAHYSGEAGKTAQRVNMKWDALLDPEHDNLLSLTHLQNEIPDVHWTPEASGISISPASNSRLEELWKAHLSSMNPSTYSTNDAMSEVFLDAEFFEEICELARRRKNIVLQGPPGVGKTFIAKHSLQNILHMYS